MFDFVLIDLNLSDKLLILVHQVLYHTLLLCIFLHQDSCLLLKSLIYRHIMFTICQPFILLVFREEVVLDLDKRLISDFFKLSLELVIFLLKFFNVLVFNRDCALYINELFLLLIVLLLKVGFEFFDFSFFQC